MKKIIGIIFISLMFCNIGFANVWVIEKIDDYKVHIYVICVDGYKFILHPGGWGKVAPRPSIVQAFEERDGKSLPAKC